VIDDLITLEAALLGERMVPPRDSNSRPSGS
jgi:hypothetical protein